MKSNNNNNKDSDVIIMIIIKIVIMMRGRLDSNDNKDNQRLYLTSSFSLVILASKSVVSL